MVRLLYEPDKTTSLGKINDVKPHEASSTTASLQAIFKFVDLSDKNFVHYFRQPRQLI